jgi:hypothetical protein
MLYNRPIYQNDSRSYLFCSTLLPKNGEIPLKIKNWYIYRLKTKRPGKPLPTYSTLLAQLFIIRDTNKFLAI